MKTIIKPLRESAEEIAQLLCQSVSKKPDLVLAIGADPSVYEVCAAWKRHWEKEPYELKNVRILAVQDYVGADAQHSLSGKLQELLSFTGSRFYALNEASAETYEETIQSLGGIDLAILGLGDNSSIGFNEPGTQYASKTHRQKLTNPTRRERALEYMSEEEVPEYGLTMGIHTIVGARNICVIASGESKAKPVFQMLYARDDSVVPSAFLQLPLNVNIYVDEAAAAKLSYGGINYIG